MASSSGEYGFKFYNNTVVNCGDFQMNDIHDALVVNNIIIPADGCVLSYDADAPFKNATCSNNCYYNYLNPVFDYNSLNILPGFCSDDMNDKNSFKLASDSPLIGSGVKVNDGLNCDLFDGAIEYNNIGCYAGGGESSETAYEKEDDNTMLVRYVLNVLKFIIHELRAMLD